MDRILRVRRWESSLDVISKSLFEIINDSANLINTIDDIEQGILASKNNISCQAFVI